MQVKNIPNDIIAEQSVLGSMFLTKYALDRACESLKEESFYLNSHQKIFKTIKEIADKKIPLDLTILTSELKQKNILDEVGGVEYLTEILDSVPTAANIDSYIQIVEEMSMRRDLIETATNIATLGYSGEGTINENLDEAEKKILGISKRRKSSEFRTIRDVLNKAQKDLLKLSETRGEITGLSTGWYDIDKVTSGLHENELIIIAARPAMGKTAFVLNLATHIAMNNTKAVALFNLEMGAEQLAMRMLSSLGQIEGNKLRTGNLLNNDWKRINEAVSQLSEANLYIDDTPGITIGEIRSKCRRLASSENGLGIVIIDYLQLISGGKGYGSNRQQEVSDISRSLKTMAMELHIPVIAIAQLSRSVEGREEKRPIMSDLRESGSIEQDADLVLFINRQDYYENKSADNKQNIVPTDLIVAKHRRGGTGLYQLLFELDKSSFKNYLKTEEEGF